MQSSTIQSGFGIMAIIIALGLIGIIGGAGVYIGQSHTPITATTSEPVATTTTKSARPNKPLGSSAEASKRASSQPTSVAESHATVHIKGITQSDLQASLKASAEVQSLFTKRPSTAHLSAEDQGTLQQAVEDIYKTEQSLNGGDRNVSGTAGNTESQVYYSNYLDAGSPSLIIQTQMPGNTITFAQVDVPFASKAQKTYFIAVFDDAGGLPGKLLGSMSMHTSIDGQKPITLTESVSNEGLFAMLFEDNGDGMLDLNTDTAVRGEGNLALIVRFQVR